MDADELVEGEIELAAELLGVSGEGELDRFIGSLFRRARGFLQSPAGRDLKDLLRLHARRLLPGVTGRGGGPVIAAEMFGIETEGLSPEDRDLELARRLVRLAREAGDSLTRDAWSDPTAARRALFDAAQRHAPGLASRIRRSSNPSNATGRWVRRRGTIVVLGV